VLARKCPDIIEETLRSLELWEVTAVVEQIELRARDGIGVLVCVSERDDAVRRARTRSVRPPLLIDGGLAERTERLLERFRPVPTSATWGS
jgi:hypothetical protein